MLMGFIAAVYLGQAMQILRLMENPQGIKACGHLKALTLHLI